MLTQKTRYALRALMMLARSAPEAPVLITQIAEGENVPRKFLELILLELKKHGFVRSFRGRNGGYALARPADTITFGQVVRIIEGPLAQVPCASLTAYRRCDDCLDERTCAMRRVFKRVRDVTAEILDSTTIASAVQLPSSH